MTMIEAKSPTVAASRSTVQEPVVALKRRTIDSILIASGAVLDLNGLTIGATTIGFLGVVDCTVPLAGQACPLDNLANRTSEANDGTQNPPSDKDHNVSELKHTLACKGEVAPLLVVSSRNKHDSGSTLELVEDITGDTLLEAAVVLECVIA